jgi:hypothetical protein
MFGLLYLIQARHSGGVGDQQVRRAAVVVDRACQENKFTA